MRLQLDAPLCYAPLKRGVSEPSLVKISLLTVLLLFLATSGCNPKRNPGDLLVGSRSSGPISISDTIGSYTALYGVEVGHPDSNRSDPARANKNLLLALFVLTPQDNNWNYSGGGSSGRPWYYRLFYSARWMDYFFTEFVIPEKSGNITENSERRQIAWKFDGRKRMITIAGKNYPFSDGDFVLVNLDKNWGPEVAVGKGSFDKLRISTKYRQLMSRCLLSIIEGVHNSCGFANKRMQPDLQKATPFGGG